MLNVEGKSFKSGVNMRIKDGDKLRNAKFPICMYGNA